MRCLGLNTGAVLEVLRLYFSCCHGLSVVAIHLQQRLLNLVIALQHLKRNSLCLRFVFHVHNVKLDMT